MDKPTESEEERTFNALSDKYTEMSQIRENERMRILIQNRELEREIAATIEIELKQVARAYLHL